MDRSSTNFCEKISKALLKKYDESEHKDILTYYQIIIAEYMAMESSRGIFAWFHMGFGKSVAAYHIADKLADTVSKTIIITPRSLLRNFQNAAGIYERFTDRTLNRDKIFFVKNSITTEKQIAELEESDSLFDHKSHEIVTTVKTLDNYLVIIEEAHIFNRKIVNGSKSVLQLYDLIMRSKCKLVMLSGSLIAANCFELAPAFNMLSGEVLFPENEQDFYELFVDRETNSIKNIKSFQDRIYGLTSRMKPEYLDEEELKDFPEELDTIVELIPMTGRHLTNYMTTRERELNDELSMKAAEKKRGYERFQGKPKMSGTFRVRSRQACNFVPSDNMLKMFKERKYEKADLEREIKSLPLEEAGGNKCDRLVNLLTERVGEKGVIYSMFTGFAGGGSLASFLTKHGAVEFGKDVEKSPETNRLVGLTFARVNGSLTETEQDDIIQAYNSPENDDGSVITVIIIAKEQCQGLDLMCVRYIVMLEPFFTDFIRDQLKYRGIRKKSHLRLPLEKRNMQFYIFLSVYPDKFVPTDLIRKHDILRVPRPGSDSEKILTTDEFIYTIMVNNAQLLNTFKVAIEEVAVDCELVKMFNPALKHICRVCAPTDEKLYTLTDNVIDGINQDITLGSRCLPNLKVKIKAETVTLVSGETSTDYYYTASKTFSGYNIYFKNDGVYEQVPESSPVFGAIIDAIKKKSGDLKKNALKKKK